MKRKSTICGIQNLSACGTIKMRAKLSKSTAEKTRRVFARPDLLHLVSTGDVDPGSGGPVSVY